MTELKDDFPIIAVGEKSFDHGGQVDEARSLSKIVGNDIVHVSGGLGSVGVRLRYWFLVSPVDQHRLTHEQIESIKNIFKQTAKGYDSIIENGSGNADDITFLVLVGLDTAIGEFIEAGIKKVNTKRAILRLEYLLVNTHTPTDSEIQKYLATATDK